MAASGKDAEGRTAAARTPTPTAQLRLVFPLYVGSQQNNAKQLQSQQTGGARRALCVVFPSKSDTSGWMAEEGVEAEAMT